MTSTISAWIVFRITAIAVFLVSIDSTITIAAIPEFRNIFSQNSTQNLSWILNAYTIVYAAMLVPAGQLADMYGSKKVFIWGLFVFGMSSLFAGLSDSLWMLVVFRAIQGLGGALLLPSSLAIVLEAFPIEKRAQAVALWSAVGALAAAVGPVAGGFIIEKFSWHMIFYINIPFVLYTIYMSNKKIEGVKELKKRNLDYLGVAILPLLMTMIILGLIEIENWGHESLFLTGIGLIGLLIFSAKSKDKDDAIIDIQLFKNKNFVYANLATLVFGIAFTMMFVNFFLFLTGIWGLPLDTAGLWITPGPLMVIPTAILGGKLASKIGHRPLLVMGGFIYALSNILFLYRATSSIEFMGVWLPSALLGGIGVGLILPSLSGSAVAGLRKENFAQGNATNSAIRQIGSAIGAALTILLVGRLGADFEAFKNIYICLIVLGLLTALCSLPINTKPIPRSN